MGWVRANSEDRVEVSRESWQSTLVRGGLSRTEIWVQEETVHVVLHLMQSLWVSGWRRQHIGCRGCNPSSNEKLQSLCLHIFNILYMQLERTVQEHSFCWNQYGHQPYSVWLLTLSFMAVSMLLMVSLVPNYGGKR